MFSRLVAVLLLSSVGAGATAAAPLPSSKCASAEHRRLDFWAGDWDVYEVGGGDRPVARARVDVILDGREAFLRDTAAGPGVTAYKLEEVRVRILGDTALIHATGVFARNGGTTGTSRYTDVWTLRDGRWRAVSAQITRIPSSPK